MPRTLITRAVASTLALHNRPDETVDILLTNDDEIRELNQRYRKVDEATDVLSFPGGDYPNAPLGDIAISVPYADRQATARGVSLSSELAFLAIHGTLHLLGFEDEKDEERAEMIREMNRAAIAAGLKPDHDWASLLHDLEGETA